MVDHTVKAYGKELDALGRSIVEMGGIAEKMVVDTMDALANADARLAHQVVTTDPQLDALQRKIERPKTTRGGRFARNHRCDPRRRRP